VSPSPPDAISPRAYAAVIAAVFVLAALVSAHWLLHRTEHLAGTDSVNPATYVFAVPKGHSFCVRDLPVPASADRVRMALVPQPGTAPRVSIQLSTGAGYSARSTRVVSAQSDAVFPIPRVSRTSPGTLCGTVTDYVSVAGFPQLAASGRPQSFVDHKPQPGGRAAVWFIDSRKRSLLSLLPAASHRASVFRAGFVGPWVYLAALLLMPLIWWLGLRRLLRERA
jgi:hypothetical protein